MAGFQVSTYGRFWVSTEEVDAIDPDINVVPVGEAPLLKGAVLGLPLVGQPRDVGGRQPGRIVPEQRRQGLAEVAGGQAA
jgi:hypothetical protein